MPHISWLECDPARCVNLQADGGRAAWRAEGEESKPVRQEGKGSRGCVCLGAAHRSESSSAARGAAGRRGVRRWPLRSWKRKCSTSSDPTKGPIHRLAFGPRVTYQSNADSNVRLQGVSQALLQSSLPNVPVDAIAAVLNGLSTSVRAFASPAIASAGSPTSGALQGRVEYAILGREAVFKEKKEEDQAKFRCATSPFAPSASGSRVPLWRPPRPAGQHSTARREMPSCAAVAWALRSCWCTS